MLFFFLLLLHPATLVLKTSMNYTIYGGIAIALAAAATTPTAATTITIHDNAIATNVAVADAPTRNAQSRSDDGAGGACSARASDTY